MARPIVNIIKNTKIKSRLFSTLILLSIPLFCLFYLTLTTQNRAIEFGEKEIIPQHEHDGTYRHYGGKLQLHPDRFNPNLS